MKTTLAVSAVAALWALGASAPAQAAFDCTYDPATRSVTADLDATGSVGSGLVAHEGRIEASQRSGVGACGEATVANTDSVTVNNVTPGGGLPDAFRLELPTDLFGGATDEPGDSDEIEMTVNLGAGYDGFRLRSGPDSDYTDPTVLSVGEDGSRVAVNVNAGESTGYDNDIEVTGLDFLEIEALGGDDSISAAGSGDAGSPYSGPLYVSTFGGRDSIVGGSGDDNLNASSGGDLVDGANGSDWIHAGLGGDRVYGGEGEDRIKAGDGDDVTRGGPGDDVIRDRAGHDTLNGGSGYDVCVDGDGEARFRGCEVERTGA